ncbi:MAG: minor capsid protein P11 domain-containing protein [Candidatus Thorarchaeota archaeon]
MSKQMFSPATLMFLGAIILLALLHGYSGSKGTEFLTAKNSAGAQDKGAGKKPGYEFVGEAAAPTAPSVQEVRSAAAGGAAGPVQPATQYVGTNEHYKSVSGVTNSQGLPPSCNLQETIDPKELLPSNNAGWGTPNPSNALQNVNLLQAGYHIGIDTVGQSLRNANLQVRSEPANPQMQVGPWNNTTIEPDLMRVPLELGCGPQ